MKENAAGVFKSGEFENAIKLFEECLEMDTLNAAFNSTILLNMAICQTKLDRKDEAIKSLGTALKYKPNYAKALVKRGEIYLSMQEFNYALNDFTTAAEYDQTGFGVQEKIKHA